jgi:hypothetical protein
VPQHIRLVLGRRALLEGKRGAQRAERIAVNQSPSALAKLMIPAAPSTVIRWPVKILAVAPATPGSSSQRGTTTALPGTSQLRHLCEYQMHSLLHAAVGINLTLPFCVHRNPTGNRNCNSRSRAFWQIASSDRCMSSFNSNSDRRGIRKPRGGPVSYPRPRQQVQC